MCCARIVFAKVNAGPVEESTIDPADKKDDAPNWTRVTQYRIVIEFVSTVLAYFCDA